MAQELEGGSPESEWLKSRLAGGVDEKVSSPEPKGYLDWVDAGLHPYDAMWIQNALGRESSGPTQEEHVAQRRRLEQFRGSQN